MRSLKILGLLIIITACSTNTTKNTTSNSCKEPKIINKTKYPINSHDLATLKHCQKRCVYYYSDAPCLKEFYKIGEQDYYCLCGESE